MEFFSYDIESNDFRRAGAASRAIKERLKLVGAEADAIRRTMIAAYEAEMNVVIHSVGGRLEASLSPDRVDVNVTDEGPGIPDIDRAMQEGYSTASAEARALGFGAGMGLPNIRRSSDRLRVTSRPGEGTRVSFTVYLQPETACAAPPISLYASADRCRVCHACLSACPTQALRVREGRPMVLEHLCIECAQCVAACTSGALTVRDTLLSVDDVRDRAAAALVAPPALLAGFGPEFPPDSVRAALNGLGFADARTVEPVEEALRHGALGEAAARAVGAQDIDRELGVDRAGKVERPPEAERATGAGRTSGGDDRGPHRVAGAAPAARPVILPLCPAVVNLVELKFPSLVTALAPFESPWAAVAAGAGEERIACVVSCPGQRSAVSAAEASAAEEGCSPRETDCLLPEALRGPVMRALTDGPGGTAGSGPRPETPEPLPVAGGGEEHGRLVVSGIRHVMAVLEELEDGLLDDVEAIEAYACEGGCFGSPLLFEDHHVARWRYERGGAAAARPAAPATGAVPLRRPYAPRSGIRLDPDMSKAIEKLGRLQALTRSLPGRDCGACGAPTCAALAEDIVMERATMDLCPHLVAEEEDAES